MRNFSKAQEDPELQKEREDYINEMRKQDKNFEHNMKALPPNRINQMLNTRRYHKALRDSGEYNEVDDDIDIMRGNAQIDRDERELKAHNKMLKQGKVPRKQRKQMINAMRDRLANKRFEDADAKHVAYLKSKGIKHFSFQ